jgi:ribonuclease HI
VVINKNMVWVFFYGICQGPSSSSGCGFKLHFSDSHYVTQKATLGPWTNNIGELNAISLLKCVVERNVIEL